MGRYSLNGEYLGRIWRAATLANTSCLAALPCSPHVSGPAALVAALVLALQQLLKGAAASCRVRAPGPLLLVGCGPVAGCARDFNQLALQLLQPAALLIALVGQKQVAAVRAALRSAGAAAEAVRAVLDRNRDALPPAPAGQVPFAPIGGQAPALCSACSIVQQKQMVVPGCSRRR